jgi:mannose-6-phosphate isomerase-like protein (cupin superfamily)
MTDFTKIALPDVKDMAPQFDQSGILQAHFATRDLALDQLGVSYLCLKPDQRIPWAHHHETQEELYVVQAGSGHVELDGERIPLQALDAVRIGATVERRLAAGPDGLDIIAIGVPALTGGKNDAVQSKAERA